MRKLRLYLDTSVLSNLEAKDAPELMEYSLKLWEEIKADSYHIYISTLVITEISRCPEPKRSILIEYLNQIQYAEVELSTEVEELANEYVLHGLIPAKYIDDAYHIAVATTNGCSAILSWNFNHMVKLKTILGVNGINRIQGYGEIEIITPISIVGGKEE